MFSFLRTAGGDTRTRNRRNRRTPPKILWPVGGMGLGTGWAWPWRMLENFSLHSYAVNAISKAVEVKTQRGVTSNGVRKFCMRGWGNTERLAKILGTCWGMGGFCAPSDAELSCQLCEKLRFMRVDVRGLGESCQDSH